MPAAEAFPWWLLPPWIDLTGFALLTLSPEHLSAKKCCGLAQCLQLLTKQCTGRALLHVNLSGIPVLGHVESVWIGFPAKALSHWLQVSSSWEEVEVVLVFYLIYPRISFLTGDYSHPVTQVPTLWDAGKSRIILSCPHYLMMLPSSISSSSSLKSVAVLMFSCRSFLTHPFKF